MCSGHEYFIPITKFVKYPSTDSVVKAESVFPYIHKLVPHFFHLIKTNKKSLKFLKHLNLYYMHSPTFKHGYYTKLMQIKLLTT